MIVSEEREAKMFKRGEYGNGKKGKQKNEKREKNRRSDIVRLYKKVRKSSRTMVRGVILHKGYIGCKVVGLTLNPNTDMTYGVMP